MRKIFILFCLSFLLFTAACTKFDESEPISTQEAEETGPRTRSGGVPVYDSLPDPYFIEVMQAVYDSLSPTPVVLTPTDLYVRFLPQDHEQLNRLEDEYGLDLFDYPLDLDIPDGETYIDPTLPEGALPWQYITVKPDFVFPTDITYEILRECYIPENDEVIKVLGTRGGAGRTFDVEMMAYEKLGYNVDGPATRSGGGGGQHPQGFVYVDVNGDGVIDTNIDEPVREVRVKVKSHTKIKITKTDWTGYFYSDLKFWQYNLKYVVVFMNEWDDYILWRVTDGYAFARTKHIAEMTKWGGNINITSGHGVAWHWASIFTSAYNYYRMCEETQISKPPRNLKILHYPTGSDMFGGSCAVMAHRDRDNIRRLLEPFAEWGAKKGYFDRAWKSGLLTVMSTNGPDLIMDSYGTYRRAYEVVNHELSHASHYSRVGDDYWEKYIKYMGNSLTATDEIYGNGDGEYAGNCAVGEMWGYAMGHIRECERFDTDRLRRIYRPGTNNFDRPGTGDWIHPDPIWALITQNVLTKKQVFDCLTGDVDTVEKLMNKLCTNYPRQAQQIRFAFTTDILPVIDGPLSTVVGTRVTYSVPVTAGGVTFQGYRIFKSGSEAVSGTDYTLAAGSTLSSINLRITFLQKDNYRIRASFEYPDGEIFTSPTLYFEVANPLTTPVMKADCRIAKAGGTVCFFDEFNQYATYEWQIKYGQRGTMSHELKNYSAATLHMKDDYEFLSAKCRVSRNGDTSAWSNEFIVYNEKYFTISGPERVLYNGTFTYSVPSSQPTGVVFMGYTISGGDYFYTGSLTNRNLSIKFTNAGRIYTITARYRLPDNTIQEVSKEVTVAAITRPVISANKTAAFPGEEVTFTVDNHVAGTKYAWSVNNGNSYYSSVLMDPSLTLPMGDYLEIECQTFVDYLRGNKVLVKSIIDLGQVDISPDYRMINPTSITGFTVENHRADLNPTYTWYKNGQQAYQSTTKYFSTPVSEYTEVYCSVSYAINDPYHQYRAENSAVSTIYNAYDYTPVISLSKTYAMVGDVVTCTVQNPANDILPGEVIYRWFVNSEEVPNTSPTGNTFNLPINAYRTNVFCRLYFDGNSVPSNHPAIYAPEESLEDIEIRNYARSLSTGTEYTYELIYRNMASGAGNPTVQWEVSGGTYTALPITESWGQSIVVVFNNAGPQYVKANITSGTGQKYSVQKDVTVQ